MKSVCEELRAIKERLHAASDAMDYEKNFSFLY